LRASYPWYVSDWRNSETRLRLSLEARAVYRELLDYIYFNSQASLPTDPQQLRKIAECSQEQFDRNWAEIARLFYEEGGRLRNRKADSVVLRLDDYSAQRRAAGKASAKARNQRLFNERSTSVQHMFDERNKSRPTGDEPGPFNERSTSVQPDFVDDNEVKPQRAFNERSTSVQPLSTTSSTTTVDVDEEAKRPKPTLSGSHEWPATAAAIVGRFRTADTALVRQVVEASARSWIGVDSPKIPEPDDQTYAAAVEVAARESSTQKSAALFLKTVPVVIENWAKHGRNGYSGAAAAKSVSQRVPVPKDWKDPLGSKI
jgi:uncharacterized protein YdaU (DUF1376 family)